MRWAVEPNATLVTYGLGSCVAVVFHDRVAKIAALLHAQLPIAEDHAALARSNPYTFVDTGIASTLDELERLGCCVERLTVTGVGGANLHENATVGMRNCAAFEDAVRRWRLHVAARHLGSDLARTVHVALPDGRVTVRSPTSGVHMLESSLLREREPQGG